MNHIMSPAQRARLIEEKWDWAKRQGRGLARNKNYLKAFPGTLNLDDIDEVTSIALIQAVDSWDQDLGTLDAHLAARIKYAVLDEVRRAWNWHRHHSGGRALLAITETTGDEWQNKATSREEEPTLQAVRNEDKELLAAAIEQLDPYEQELIKRHYINGESGHEMARKARASDPNHQPGKQYRVGRHQKSFNSRIRKAFCKLQAHLAALRPATAR